MHYVGHYTISFQNSRSLQHKKARNESLNITNVYLILQTFTPETWSVHVRFVVDKVAMGQFFPPSTSVSPCQYHSTNTPYPFSSTRSSSKTDKWTKTGDRLKAMHFGKWVPLDIKSIQFFRLQRVKYLTTYHV
jgi:hypothetical protein